MPEVHVHARNVGRGQLCVCWLGHGSSPSHQSSGMDPASGLTGRSGVGPGVGGFSGVQPWCVCVCVCASVYMCVRPLAWCACVWLCGTTWLCGCVAAAVRLHHVIGTGCVTVWLVARDRVGYYVVFCNLKVLCEEGAGNLAARRLLSFTCIVCRCSARLGCGIASPCTGRPHL
jgi:hypothetical protein